MPASEEEPKRDYRRMAQKAGKIWREHGALEFRECVGDDSERQNGNAVSARNQNQARRNGSVLLHRVTSRERIVIA